MRPRDSAFVRVLRVAALAAAVLSSCAAARAQSLDFPRRCVQVPVVNREVCASFSVDTCTERVAVSASLDGNALVDFNVSVYDARYCVNEDQPCHQCFDFKSVLVEPGYVNACPRVTATGCPGGLDIPLDLQCFELGDRCEAEGCYECAQQDNCGWCGATSSCVATRAGGVGAYCNGCETSDFTTNSQLCADAPQDNSGSDGDNSGRENGVGGGGGGGGGSSTGLIVGVSIAIFAGLLAAGAMVAYALRRRERRPRSGASDEEHSELGEPYAPLDARPLSSMADASTA